MYVCVYGMMIIRKSLMAHFYSCANERQDDEPAPVNTRQTLMSSGNRTPTSQQTDRQTNELYVCLKFFRYVFYTSVVSFKLRKYALNIIAQHKQQ